MRHDKPYTTAGLGGDPPSDQHGGSADDGTEMVHRFSGFIVRGDELRVVLTRTYVDRETRKVVRYGRKVDHRATAYDVRFHRFAEYCNRHPRKAPGLIAAAAGL